MKNGDTLLTKNDSEKVRRKEVIPLFEDDIQIPDDKVKEHRKRLRQFFLNAENFSLSTELNFASLAFTSSSNAENQYEEYPLVFDHESHELKSLNQLFLELLYDYFDKEDADKLSTLVPGIVEEVSNLMKDEIHSPLSEMHINEIIEGFRKQGSGIPDISERDQQWDVIQKKMLATRASLIEFSAKTPLQLLKIQLEQRRIHHQEFLELIKKSIVRINEILVLQRDEKDPSQSHYDFASPLLSFDKIDHITPAAVSSNLSQPRLNRLKECLDCLIEAEKSYKNQYCTVFTNQKLSSELELKQNIGAEIRITAGDACNEAKNHFQGEIQEFIKLISALRLAQLEIEQKYDETLHTPYFESFDRSYLSNDDLKKFRPLIVIDESRNIMQQPQGFLGLLAEGAEVKVLAVNRLEDILKSKDQQFEGQSYLELAALAFFRRNAFVFQGACDHPFILYNALKKGLNSPLPVLWNLLFTNSDSNEVDGDYLKMKIAVASRYFPELIYDIQSGKDFIGHLDVSTNHQADQSFPQVNQKIRTAKGQMNLQISITPADYIACFSGLNKLLQLIPEGYPSNELISLADYMEGSQEDVAGKIPYIWVADENDKVKQAIIPVSWIRFCRTRLEYWQFLQELSGVKSDHINQVIEENKSQWESEKDSEIENLRSTLQSSFEQRRIADLGSAISKMLNTLLGSEEDMTQLLTKLSTGSAITEETIKKEDGPYDLQEDKSQASEVSASVWVESDECTSCHDCIDDLPAVFKYNSNKQAIVHNPKGGSYAKIVKIAEKCPARCIHPGLPHNADEPGLDKLIKRAEKFN